MEIAQFDASSVPAGTKTAIEMEVTRLPGGMPVTFSALVVRGAKPGKSIVVTGGVHGDEYEGPLAVLKLFQTLQPAKMAGTFVGIPVVNPPAFDAGTRSSPLDDQNLARVFPGKSDGTVSEKIAHALLQHVIPQGDMFLDLHSGGVKYECPLTCGFYLLEGEMGRVSKEAALAFGAEVVWGFGLNHGRSISEAVRHKNVPAIYAETTGGGGVLPADLDAYVLGTQNVMKYLGILPGRPKAKAPEIYYESTDITRDFDKAINCTVSGIFESKVRCKQKVKTGQVIGLIYDLAGNVAEEIRADQAGYVMGLRRFSRILAGELVALVA
jgi:predicted deacylase